MRTPMSSAARSSAVYGIYLILFIALPFLCIPDLLLPLVGMSGHNDVWIRVLGMSTILFGIYYIQAGRHGLTAFIRWTVYGRFTVPLFFIAFVALGFAPPILIAFSIPDILFTTWTAIALRGTPKG